jgi:hypothetical protein
LLITFNAMNPWTGKIVRAMTKNPAVSVQIAFWRMRDIKTNNMRFPPNTIVKMKRMFEVVKSHYTMQIARSFWKIDRCDVEGHSQMDSSFLFTQKFAMQQPKEDFNSDMYSENSFAKQTPARTFGNKGGSLAQSTTNLHPGARKEPSVISITPARAERHSVPTEPMTSPRGTKANTLGGGLLGRLGKR